MPGFAEGFAQGKADKQDREDREELKKLQIKKFKADLDLQEKQAAAREKFISMMKPKPPMMPSQGVADSLGSIGINTPPLPATKGRAFADIATDSEFQAAGIGAGIIGPRDVMDAQRQGQVSSMLGGNGGLVLSGIKLDTHGNPLYDFDKRKLGKEVPAPDGTSIIQLDQFGNELARRPIGPDERSGEDKRSAILDVERQNKVSTAFATIDELERLYDDIANAKTLVDKGVAVKLYDDFLIGTLAPVVKAAGESGNLATEDIERALKMPPGGLSALTEKSRTKIGKPKFQNLRKWFEGLAKKTTSKKTDITPEDISKMTDEELKALANGRR